MMLRSVILTAVVSYNNVDSIISTAVNSDAAIEI